MMRPIGALDLKVILQGEYMLRSLTVISAFVGKELEDTGLAVGVQEVCDHDL
jgi:hypothetical protein